MKKILFVLTLTLFLPAAITLNHEEIENNNASIDAKLGLTPDSFLYSGELFMDRIRIMLSIGPNSEVNTKIDVAEKRLVETREMANRVIAFSGEEELKNAEAMTMSQREYREQIRSIVDITINEGISFETRERAVDKLSLYSNVLESIRNRLEENGAPGTQGIKMAINQTNDAIIEIEGPRNENSIS